MRLKKNIVICFGSDTECDDIRGMHGQFRK